MARKVFADRFASFVAAQYGQTSPDDLPTKQRLEVEDAYMAGAAAGFYHGFGCDDQEAIAAHKELTEFGTRIVSRYKRAGLPTGARRS